MRVAIYARKSSESEDRQVQSLDDQSKVLFELARENKYEIVEVLRESKSAKDPDERPEFKKLIHLIEKQRIDGILTWHINRLSRNMIDGGRIAHLLHEGSLQFIRTPERVFRPEDNVLLFAIENATATHFIHDLKRNVARGMNSKAERGWFPGRAPLGYVNNVVTNEIDVDPARFDLIRSGWDMLLDGGRSVAEIYRTLVDSGLTMRGRGGRERPLHQKSVYDIFTNRFYTGQFSFRGNVYPGKHRAMVSSFEFDLAQTLLCPNTPRRLQRTNEPAYAGLFRCERCGLQMVADIKRKTLRTTGQPVEYIYYRCSGSRGCGKSGLRENRITDRVVEMLNSFKISSTQAEWCRSVLIRNFNDHRSKNDQAMVAAQDRLRVLRARSANLTLLFADGSIERTDFEEARGSVQEEVKEIEERVRRLGGRDEQALAWINRQIELAVSCSKFKWGGSTLRRTVLASLGSAPTLGTERVNLDIHPTLVKIGMFEPANSGSEKDKTPSLQESASSWGDWCEEIRTAAYEWVDREISSMSP